MAQIKIKINYENNAETWWQNGGSDLFDSYPAVESDPDEIYLDNPEAFLERARLIPGWEESPTGPVVVVLE